MSRFIWAATDAFYVNLGHRTDRLEHMKRECARVGLDHAVRYPAFTPDEYTGDPERVRGMMDRTPGALGCFMSQTAIMQSALANKKNVLILEDDVIFCDDLTTRMGHVERRLDIVDPKWQVFSLGATFHVNPPVWHKDDALGRDVERTKSQRILRVYGSWFTFAYVVRWEAIRDVLKALDDNLPGSWGIDHNFITLGDKLRCYAYVPGCAFQLDGKSDIGTGGDGITRFSGFLKTLGPYVFTKKFDEFDPVAFDWGEAER